MKGQSNAAKSDEHNKPPPPKKRMGRPPGSRNKSAHSKRWTRKSLDEVGAQDDSKRASVFEASHKFRYADGTVKAPLFVVLRILRIRHRIERELLLPVVILTDGACVVEGEPGEGVWDMLERTKLILTAERAWNSAGRDIRAAWVSLFNGIMDVVDQD